MIITYPLEKLPSWMQLALLIFFALLIVLGVIGGWTRKVDEP